MNHHQRRATEPSSKKVRDAHENINKFLKRWRDYKDMLSMLLSELNDPVLMFVLTKGSHADQDFMTDFDLWRGTAVLYFKHIKDPKGELEDPLKLFENLLHDNGVLQINYFRMMLALHLVKYHLLAEEGHFGGVPQQNISEITQRLQNTTAVDESSNFISTDIDFVSPVMNRFFSLRFDVMCIGGAPYRFEYSIVISSPQLAGEVVFEEHDEEQFEVLRVTSIYEWYPELENHLGIYFDEQADTEHGWGENTNVRWSHWEQLFVVVYQILELPGIKVRLPFNQGTDKETKELINKKLY